MSEIAGQPGRSTDGTPHRTSSTHPVHESYSFACMRCGHGWEQAYEIEHHFDAKGAEFVTYVADGLVVPSPLSRPSCVNCEGRLVRIMRAGQVSSAQSPIRRTSSVPPMKRAAARGTPDPAPEAARAPGAVVAPKVHHWHLSDLLHPFHHRRAV